MRRRPDASMAMWGSRALAGGRMSQSLLWLTDAELDGLAQSAVADQAMTDQRFDPSCPSEFYRGYATILADLADTGPAPLRIDAFRRRVDDLDAAVSSVEDGERTNGASFALANAAQYAINASSIGQIMTT